MPHTPLASSDSCDEDPLVLHEFACLGVLALGPAHGYVIAAQLLPAGRIGRVWPASRPRTYTALHHLLDRSLVRAIGLEPGTAGGNRTILALTDRGEHVLAQWLATVVADVRDRQGELLLKLVIAAMLGTDIRSLIERQRRLLLDVAEAVDGTTPVDVARSWLAEHARATLRVLDGVGSPDPTATGSLVLSGPAPAD